MNYEVLFELFGKKMKTKITASSKVEAKQKIFNKVIFHKITESEDIDVIGFFNDIFKTK